MLVKQHNNKIMRLFTILLLRHQKSEISTYDISKQMQIKVSLVDHHRPICLFVTKLISNSKTRRIQLNIQPSSTHSGEKHNLGLTDLFRGSHFFLDLIFAEMSGNVSKFSNILFMFHTMVDCRLSYSLYCLVYISELHGPLCIWLCVPSTH